MLNRRAFLAATAASSVAPPAPSWLSTMADRARHLNGPGLLLSYEVGGDTDFDQAHGNCAYVYDNAVAGLALLAAGETALAARLGDALATAQARDRFFHDGRLRNAYAAGPAPAAGSYPLPGWWDARRARWLEDGYQAGTATGVLAWAMLLWLALARRTNSSSYLTAARRAADWVEQSVAAPRGFLGGFLGFEPKPQPLTWVSTEHCIDLAVAFTALQRPASATHAREFVASMFLPAERRFASGLRPDGSLNDHSAVDANLWPLLAPGADPAWTPALDWILAQHGVPQADPDGVDFNNDRDGIWLEGTAIAALALRGAGARAASRFMATLHAQTAPSGLIYACTTPTLTTGLSTGLDTKAPDFLYYRRPALAPTAWATLAAAGASPFAEL